MALIDELNAARIRLIEMRALKKHEINDAIEAMRCIDSEIAEHDLAIAALQPGEVTITVSNDEPDPADQPALTDAEFEALEPFDVDPPEIISDLTGDPAIEPESGLHGEPIDAAPEAQILREHVPMDAPVIEDGAGEQFAILQGEPVQIISEEPKLPHEPHEENPAASFWGKALAKESEEREQARSLMQKLFGAKEPADA